MANVIKAFFEEYGYTFIMMIIVSAVTALTLEISVKSVFANLCERFKDRTKIVEFLKIAKAIAIQIYVWVFIVLGLNLICENMPLPANKTFYLVWLGVMYVMQYIFSYFGIKGLLAYSEKRLERSIAKAEAKAKADADKPVLVAIEGRTGLYNLRDANGALIYDEFGRLVIVNEKGKRV